MDNADDGPLQIQFISGVGKDGRSLSIARSHAMKTVRGRQKRRKQREAVRRGQALSLLQSERVFQPEICTLKQATLDPFNMSAMLPHQLTRNYAHIIDEIKAHALTTCPMQGVMYPVAAQNPALMISLLYVSYAHLWALRGSGDATFSLRLKASAISEINRKMAHPSTATCTNLIAAVAYLAMGTWSFDNPLEETTAHLDGVKAMVAHRGMSSLGVYKFGQSVRKLLALQEAVMAGLRATKASPVFDLDLDNEIDSTTVQEPTNTFVRSSWNEIRQYLPSLGGDRERLRRLVDDIDGLEGLVAAEENGAMTATDCLHQLGELYEQVSDGEDSHVEKIPPSSWVLETFRLAVKMVIETLIARRTLTTNDPIQSAALVDSLRRGGYDRQRLDTALVSLFVLMVGCASASNWQDRRYLRCMLGQTVAELALIENGFRAGTWMAQRFNSLQATIIRRSLQV